MVTLGKCVIWCLYYYVMIVYSCLFFIYYRRFYLVVRGKKDKYKHVLMNECLSLCAAKWYNLTRFKSEGVKIHLHSDAFFTYMKTLFSVFAKEGIEFKLKDDFNLDHQFHAIAKATWAKGKALFIYCIFHLSLIILITLFFKKLNRTQHLRQVVGEVYMTRRVIAVSEKLSSMIGYLLCLIMTIFVIIAVLFL